ncbi:MAG: chromosome segregation protein SMC [Desulfobacteraceae bacterium]|nr:chromosome segregation protein SMC [Desulfobacteraceae bacterium]
MQLKRIDIYGFKSFAERCTIVFPPGISAVVGPNGCGKSNIIDAIKWVMGEQSVKQLRGKSMGDVIFSGTDKKAAVNMAEVSLTLSGMSEQAPASVSAYEEIMVTRRLYRSGESRYMINKQPCRLKDISDIFLRSGMGARSCAIIQQGNIGAITDATAEERRTFIEEAAGVMRYKTRRQEALVRVKSTRQNLDRINDILDEIGKQLEVLEQEAETARQYNARMDGLKRADMLISVYYYEQYERRINENRQLLQRLKEKDELNTESLEQLNAALQEIEARRTHEEKALSGLRNQKTDLQRSIDQTESRLQHLEDEQSRLTRELSQLQESLEKTRHKNQQIETEIRQAEEKAQSLESEIQELQSSLARQESASDDDKQQLAELKQQLETHKKNQSRLSARQAKYNNVYSTALSNKEQIKRRLKQAEKEKNETADQIAELAETEADQQQRQDALNQEKTRLESEISSCRELLKEQSQQLHAQIKTVNELQQSRAQIKSQLGVLKRMESNFEWYKDGVRAIMQARQTQAGKIGFDPSECLDIVGNLIEPDPGYEPAAEAALGEALQYIVVKAAESGIRAIDFLKNQKAGRSGFIFLEPGRQHPENPEKNPDTAPHQAPKVTRLQDHVRTRPGFEPVVHSLLSGVGVCDDLQTARSLIDPQKGFRILVTRDGDMAAAPGMVVGGSKDRLAGILEKKQEIRQLEQNLADTNQQLDSAKGVQENLEKSVRGHENDLARLTEASHKYQTNLVEVDKELYKTGESLRQARRRLEVATLEQQRLEGEKQDIRQELAEHDNILAEIDQQMSDLESGIRDTETQIRELEEQIRVQQNARMDIKLKVTRRSAELENAQSTVSRLKSFREENTNRISEIQQEMDHKQQQADQAAGQIQEGQKQLKNHKQEMAGLQEDLRTRQSDYQSLVGRQKKTDATISGTQSELEEIRKKIHQIELDLSGLHINQENLVNRFLEKYADSFEQVRTAYRDQVLAADFSIEKTEKTRTDTREKINAMGEVNLGAIEAYESRKQRYDFLAGHRDDLMEALGDLENVIRKINRITRKLFLETFEAINRQFSGLFPRLFNGGAAWLELTEPDKPMETGVELMIHPPGKKVTRLSLLSGGEKALSAIAFIFSIFFLNPAAFCLLDEIDAPLDDVNVERFNELLKIIGENTQIIMISHNKKTMEFSDILFGVTMAGSGVSRVISVNVEQALQISKQNTHGNHNKGSDHAAALN